jgi:hypothetical protein
MQSATGTIAPPAPAQDEPLPQTSVSRPKPRERTFAMTAVSTVPRWWTVWLTTVWPIARRLDRLHLPGPPARALIKLNSINFAHWSLFAPPERRRRDGPRPPHRYLLFQSNYSGESHGYVEGFCEATPLGMRGLWGGADGVPDPQPAGPFVRYVSRVEKPIAHYYRPYPHASPKMIKASLELRRRFEAFERQADWLDDEEFPDACREFLADVQRLL